MLNLHPRSQHLLTYLDACRTSALASAAVQAVIHMVAEIVGRREQTFLHLAHQLHAPAWRLYFQQVGGVGRAGRQARTTPDTCKQVVVVGRVLQTLIEWVV